MAKRFTDTDKWKREWFSTLDPKAKLVWIYILDQCDHCGVWPRNMKLLSDQTGLTVTEAQFQNWFRGKVVRFDHDKYFIPSFFDFQYGSSKDGFKARQSAIATLAKMGLMTPDGVLLKDTSEHLDNSSELSMDCPSISIGKSIGISNNKKEDGNLKNQILEVYSRYPLKKGKEKGIQSLLKSILSEDVPALAQAVEKYRSICEREKKDPKYILHFSTFANHWREILEDDWGTSNIQSNTDWDVMTVPLRGT